MSQNIHLVSLGCARNLVDSEVMLGASLAQGFKAVPNPESADVIVVNTCGFIGPAKQESIDTILQMAQFKESGRAQTLVVTGCLAQRYQETLAKELPEVDYFIGTGEFPKLPTILKEKPAARGFFRRPRYIYDDAAPRVHSGARHSAYLKIAEGCSTRCAFCIIPKLRGPLRSRSAESILTEARRLVSTGVREINVIAQDLTDFGRDLGLRNALPELLADLEEVDGLTWARLMYCYPDKITAELIDTMARSRVVVPYIDMPIQHASSDVLKAMNRSVSNHELRDVITRLRSAIPGLAIRTAVIAGFPGETADQHHELIDFISEMKFEHLGVFRYSAEEGTPAAKLPGHLDEETIAKRQEALMAAQQKVSGNRLERWVGRTVDVMIDGVDDESEFLLAGRLATQAPEVDGRVILSLGPETAETVHAPGTIVRARILGTGDYDLMGEVVL